MELLVAVVAVLCIPATIAVLAWRDERAFRTLMEGQAASLDRMLNHAAATQTPGEPVSVTQRKLEVAAQDLKSRVEVAKLRQLGQIDPLVDS